MYDSFERKLVRALEHPNPEVRCRAAWLIGKRKLSSGVVPLIRILEAHEDDPVVLGAVAIALGEIGDSRAVCVLRSALKESYLPVRVRAIHALAMIADPSALSDLEEASLCDPNEIVRERARLAVEALRSKNSSVTGSPNVHEES